ncbi:hypothetical protein CJD36_018460 [Flavipsychrobacter stenotrophus]|uniref:Uncharacterized protein n=1 Tax=Flavipsychrobacter stenotrophus TaxID=2077091 RepID=A0A2S7SRQ8_9BACT|nr:hypothetical protein [Flavipsychrobacter stenotrophus]PQJ09236.1 hypothetical protein CJD36_018460 [Flavipsychrobacter stenotrophus]
MRSTKIIKWTFGLTFLGVLLYSIYLWNITDQSAQLGVPFAFIAFLSLGWFIESVLLAIIFFKDLKKNWPILLSFFLLTCFAPISFIKETYERRPAIIPQPGPLTVPIEVYQADCKLAVVNYLAKNMDSNHVTPYGDTITYEIDTLFYSPDHKYFFAIIIASNTRNGRTRFQSEYRAAKRSNAGWDLTAPVNTWNYASFSKQELKDQIRQFHYKEYSINGSSNRREIWTDTTLFSFKN